MRNRGGWLRLAGPYRVLSTSWSFRFLFVAQMLSAFMDWLYLVALFVLAYDITHSATVVALLTFAGLLPYAILSPFGGALSDRYSRGAIMASAAAGRAVCMFGLVFVNSRSTLPLAFGLVLASTSLTSLFKPALLSAIPHVVQQRDLIDADSVLSQVNMVALGAGPGIAAAILLVHSVHAAFVVAALGLLLCSIASIAARVPWHAGRQEQGDTGSAPHLSVGFGFLIQSHSHALLAMVVALAGLSLQDGAIWAILVDLSERTFHLGDSGPGILMAFYAVGGLLSGFLVGRASVHGGVRQLFVAGAGCSSLACVGLGLSPRGAFPFVCLFVVGIADAFARVPLTSAIQTATADEMLGHVFGAVESGLMFAMVLGSLIVAPLIASIGSRAAAVALAVGALVLLVLVLPWLRHLDDLIGVRIFLRQMPVLNLVPFERLDDLLQRLDTERFSPGEEIIREGDRGDRMYIVTRGRVEVVAQDANARETRINTLSRMEYFGEIALLRDAPRDASVRALGYVETYSLSRAEFERLRSGADEFEEAMESVVARRDVRRLQVLFPGR